MSNATDDVAQSQLQSFVELIESLEDEKKTISDDVKDVYAEVKGNSFDTKVLRKVISLRKQDAQERQGQEAILNLYLQSLGMSISIDYLFRSHIEINTLRACIDTRSG